MAASTQLTMPWWEWQGDSSEWTPFLQEDRAKIEELYWASSGRAVDTTEMSWNTGFGSVYRFDFERMAQVNLESKKRRLIRRRDAPCCPSRHMLERKVQACTGKVTCYTCRADIAQRREAHYHCAACDFTRCLSCQGELLECQSFQSIAQWRNRFTELSRQQVHKLTQDTAVRAQLKRDGLEVVWRQWLDTERTFGSDQGKTTTDLTLFAVGPQQLRGPAYGQRDEDFVNFPAVRSPNYCDEVDVVGSTDEIQFDVKNRHGELIAGVTLRRFLAQLGDFIPDLEPSAAWSDPIDDTPLQTSSQFSLIPSPSGHIDVGIAAFGHQCTNLHIVIGPSGDLGWAAERPGAQRIFFRDSTGKMNHTISLVPEKREEVKEAFFKLETHDETVEEERQRYEKVQNRLIHLQVTMDGVAHSAAGYGASGRGNLCPNGHPLVVFRTPQDGYVCDMCHKQRFPTGSKMFGCRICDFDHCRSCWRKCAPNDMPEPSVSQAGYGPPLAGGNPLPRGAVACGMAMPPGVAACSMGPPPPAAGPGQPVGVDFGLEAFRMGPPPPAARPGQPVGVDFGLDAFRLGAAAARPMSAYPLPTRCAAPTSATKQKKPRIESLRMQPTGMRSQDRDAGPPPASAAASFAPAGLLGLGSAAEGPVVPPADWYTSEENRSRGATLDLQDLGARVSGAFNDAADKAEPEGKSVESGLLLAMVERGAELWPAREDQQVPRGACRKPGVAVRVTYMHYGLAADGHISAERTRRFALQANFRRRELGLPHGSLVTGLGSWGGPENAPIKLFGFRLTDAADGRRALEVIEGVSKVEMPSSLRSACLPLSKTIDGVVDAARHADRAAKALKSENVAATQDQIAAFYLYTMAHSFYMQLNAAMRDEDRSKAKPFFGYLRLLFAGLEALVSHGRGTRSVPELWRGVHLDLAGEHAPGSEVTWWGASSCTPRLSVAQGFLGCSGPRTLFRVQPLSAAPIKEYSAFRGEEEWLLAPGTRLRVEAVERRDGGLVEVSLTEMPPPRDIR